MEKITVLPLVSAGDFHVAQCVALAINERSKR